MLNFSAMLCVLLLTTSCQKIKENIVENLMTLEEASETIENILDSAECGLASEMEDLAEMAYDNYDNLKTDCNYAFDTTFSCSNDGSMRAYDFMVNYSWAVICDDFNIPTTLDFNSSKNGSYSGPRIVRSGNGNSVFQLNNISPIPPGTNYTLNGTHNFSGTQELLLRNTTLELTVEMQLTDIEIAKTTFEIISGTGTFKIIGVGNHGNSETYEGTIVFLGNGQAELTINGEVFVISI